MAKTPTVAQLLDALIAKTAPPSPGTLRWHLQSHGFSASWMLEVESSGKARRRDFDMSHRSTVTLEKTISVDGLAELAQAIRSTSFPKIEVPAGYQPRPDIGQTTVSVVVDGGDSESVSLPQDARSEEMQTIGAVFLRLTNR